MPAEDGKTASLLELALSRGKKRGPDCGVAVILRTHPEDADKIIELIEATPTRVMYSVAAETFKDAGIPLKADTISRHRRKRCSCVFA